MILDGSGADLAIGNYCDVSAGVHISTHDTALRCVSMGQAGTQQSPVNIGGGIYIASQSVVTAGTIIGSRCIVGANSFVDADVPDRTIMAGSPAVPIRSVEGGGVDVRCVYPTDQ